MNFTNMKNDYIPLTMPDNMQNVSPAADNAGILLISCACNLYREKFKSNEVPFSFIDFYVNEMSHYTDTFNQPLKDFFKDYKKQNNIETFIRLYLISGYSVAKSIKTIDGYLCLVLDPNNNFFLQDPIEDALNATDKATAEILSERYNQYKQNDELKPLSEIYDDFLIEKFIENYNNEKHHKSKANAEGKTTNTSGLSGDELSNKTLIGAKNSLPNQKGKVVQINIPRFKLPMSYPIDLNNSRVLSEYKTKKFAHADKCIKTINNLKITAVGFNLSFVEKRKSVKKKKSFDKFGFDF